MFVYLPNNEYIRAELIFFEKHILSIKNLIYIFMSDSDTSSHSIGIYLVIPALIGVGFILYFMQSFMIPFVIAILLAILFAPIQVYFAKKGIPELLGSLVIFLLIFSLMTVMGLLLYGSVRAVVENSDKYTLQFNELTTEWMQFIKQKFNYDIEEEIWQEGDNNSFSFLSVESLLTTFAGSLGNFLNFFSYLLTMLLFLMFMLLSRKRLTKTIYSFLETQDLDTDKSHKIISSIGQQIQDYLWLKTLISMGTGIIVWAASLAMGLDFAIIWGFLAFILNFIPSIGPLIASGPPILLAIFQFNDNIVWAVFISIVIGMIQFLSGNIIEPKLMGDRLNLNILVVLLCLFVWGTIWGFVGMVLSVPLTASINIILNNSSRYKHLSILLSN
jgi:predicted PurR-regulated permease PerM